MIITKEKMTNPFYTFCLLQKIRDKYKRMTLSLSSIFGMDVEIFGLKTLETVEHVNNYYNFAKFIFENNCFNDVYYHLMVQGDYCGFGTEHKDGNFPIESDYALMESFLFEVCLNYCDKKSDEYKLLDCDDNCETGCWACENKCIYNRVYELMKLNDDDLLSEELLSLLSLKFDVVLSKYVSQNKLLIEYLYNWSKKVLEKEYGIRILDYETAYDKRFNYSDIMKESYKNRYVNCQRYDIADYIKKYLDTFEV